MKKIVALSALFALVASLSAPVHAVSVAPPPGPPGPPPTGDATASSDIETITSASGNFQTQSSSVNVNLSHTVSAGDFAASTLSSGTSPSTSVSVSRSGEGLSYGETDLVYFIKVNGPTAYADIDLVAAGGTSTTGSLGSADAVMLFSGLQAEACTTFFEDVCNGIPTAFTVNQSFVVQTGVWLPVEITADALTLSESDNPAPQTQNGSAYAWIDPTFSIDPAQSDAGNYGISFSPQLLAVPEPSTSTALFMGIAAIAAGLRRREGSRTKHAARIAC
jgi:hypothetical protein